MVVLLRGIFMSNVIVQNRFLIKRLKHEEEKRVAAMSPDERWAMVEEFRGMIERKRLEQEKE